MGRLGSEAGQAGATPYDGRDDDDCGLRFDDRSPRYHAFMRVMTSIARRAGVLLIWRNKSMRHHFL
jgi:hypothetical protein